MCKAFNNVVQNKNSNFTNKLFQQPSAKRHKTFSFNTIFEQTKLNSFKSNEPASIYKRRLVDI